MFLCFLLLLLLLLIEWLVLYSALVITTFLYRQAFYLLEERPCEPTLRFLFASRRHTTRSIKMGKTRGNILRKEFPPQFFKTTPSFSSSFGRATIYERQDCENPADYAYAGSWGAGSVCLVALEAENGKRQRERERERCVFVEIHSLLEMIPLIPRGRGGT